MTTTVAAPSAATVAVAGCCALLVLRPLLVQRGPVLITLTAVFLALLVIGAAWPGAGTHDAADVRWTIVLGLAAFAAARLIGGGHAPHTAVPRLLVLNAFAAIAEEALFRRLAYRL